MSNVEAYPLSWPSGWKRTTYRERSRFKVTPWKATQELHNELRRLGAYNVILSTNVALRGDGLPYSNRRSPDDPGVAVYFTHKDRSMVFACDQWRTVEENTYAIAKTIEALRGIERWSASDMLERAFTGFAALPSGGPKWWEALGVARSDSKDVILKKFRELAKENHPDHGGSPERMAEINAAYQQALAQ